MKSRVHKCKRGPMNSEPISCRIIRSCLDYAATRNIDLENILSKYDYSTPMLEDSYNWVTVDFFNEIIDKISSETGKQEAAFEIGSDSTLRNSWGDIENVIKAIANPKPILANVERFTSYFLKVPALRVVDTDNVSVTIKSVDQTGLYNNAIEFILGALISIPRLWGGNDLSAIRLKDKSIRINFSQDPCFFDTANDYKKYSPKLLEEIILGLESTKKTIEHKNKGGTSTPYYYISCTRDEGRTALYVRRKDLARARKLVGNWQDFKRAIERFEELNQEMARIARQIVALQTVEDIRNDD